MSQQNQQLYEFGPYRVDAGERTLSLDGTLVPLTPKAFDVLLVLVERDGRVVTKDELMSAVWPDSFVEEGNLTTAVYTLRKSFGEHGRFVETVPRRGYRFVGGARPVAPSSPAPAVVEPESPAEVAPADVSAEIGARPWRTRAAAAAALLVVVVLVVLAARAWPHRDPSLPRSLAVLPFKPIGTQSEDDHMGLGMADAIIGRLANVRQVLVRPTSAVRKFESGQEDPAAAGRELGVDLVVDGNIQRVDDRVRVTVQIVRTSDGTAVWNKSFDAQFTEIFAVQDSISQQVAGALPIELTADERSLLAKPHSEDAETYRLYVKGDHFWNNPNGNAPGLALQCFQEAVARDPDFALGHAGLAASFGVKGYSGEMPPKDGWSICEREARKAIELDDSLAEAHNPLAATLLYYHWDVEAAEREPERTVALGPTFPEARNIHARCLVALGRFDDAIAEYKRMIELDPTGYGALMNTAMTFYYARRYDEAIASFDELTATFPNDGYATPTLSRIYAARGETDKAAQVWRLALVAYEDDDLVAILDREYPRSGYDGAVRAIARRRLEKMRAASASGFVPAIEFARAYIDLDDADHAFEWLGRAIDERDAAVMRLRVSPEFDKLRSDPRFDALLARVVPG